MQSLCKWGFSCVMLDFFARSFFTQFGFQWDALIHLSRLWIVPLSSAWNEESVSSETRPIGRTDADFSSLPVCITGEQRHSQILEELALKRFSSRRSYLNEFLPTVDDLFQPVIVPMLNTGHRSFFPPSSRSISERQTLHLSFNCLFAWFSTSARPSRISWNVSIGYWRTFFSRYTLESPYFPFSSLRRG